MKLSLLRSTIEEIMAPVNGVNAAITQANVDVALGKLQELRTDENATLVDPAIAKLQGISGDLAREANDDSYEESEEYYESSSSY